MKQAFIQLLAISDLKHNKAKHSKVKTCAPRHYSFAPGIYGVKHKEKP